MKLNPADSRLAEAIRARLGADVLRPIADRYLEEPRQRFVGQPGLLALPRTEEDV